MKTAEEIREYKRNYYLKNKHKWKGYWKKQIERGYKKKYPKKGTPMYERHAVQMQESKEREYYGVERKVVFLRDNNQCKVCGAMLNLCVHHIDNNGVTLKKDKRNNDLNNLITLCWSCHGRIHMIKRKSWSRKIPKCLLCGTTKRKHKGLGLCSLCYEKTRKEYKKKWFKPTP